VIIDHFEELSNTRGCSVVYLYFDYKKQLDQTPLKILQTLLYQLLAAHSHVPPQAAGLRQRLESGKGLPGWQELKTTFINLCNATTDPFVVFDALDECDGESNRCSILELIRELKTSKARVLITSRPFPPDINDLLSDCRQLIVEASEADIGAYILDQMNRSAQSSVLVDQVLKGEIVASITAKSQGMFLLPALQIHNILGQTNKAQIRKALKYLPTGLADNLARTMDRIRAQHSQSRARADLALAILQWLSTAERQITTGELQHALACTEEGLDLDDLTNPNLFVDCCFGLVVVDKETCVIRLVHFSVNEFLQERRDELFKGSQGALAATSLTYIRHVARESCSGALSESSSQSVPETTALGAKWKLWDYACIYWGIHAGRDFCDEVEAAFHAFQSDYGALHLWSQYLEQTTPSYWEYWRGEQSLGAAHATHISEGTTSLHIAAVYGIAQLANGRLGGGNDGDGKGATPLMLAAARGRVDMMELLAGWEDVDINAEDDEGRTALDYAVQSAHITSVRWLLSRHDLDINTYHTIRKACLRMTYEQPDSVAILCLLFKRRDLAVNGPPEYPWRPHWHNLAADNWSFEPLRALVARPDFDVWLDSDPKRHPGAHLDEFVRYVRSVDYNAVQFPSLAESMCYVPANVLLLDSRIPEFPEFKALELTWTFVYYAFHQDLVPDGKYNYPAGEAARFSIGVMSIYDSPEKQWRRVLHSSFQS